MLARQGQKTMSSFLTRESNARLVSDQWLFWIGLAVFTVGQGMTGLSLEFGAAQRPIDYMHWLMLIGALLMLRYAVTMPRTAINRIASPLLIAGLAAIIGMAAIDFILWSYGLSPERNALIDHLHSTPTIWLPFFEIGPGWIFGLGLCLPALFYFDRAPVGVVLVAIGGIMLPLGLRQYVLLGYPVIIAGYAWCFLRSDASREGRSAG